VCQRTGLTNKVNGNRNPHFGVLVDMGHDTARVDVAEVRDAADQFDASADILDAAIREHLSHLGFSGATAGRAHVARGDRLHAALGQLNDGMIQWSRASAEVTAALRATADRFARSEDYNTARFR
jgi:hypothetical protein